MFRLPDVLPLASDRRDAMPLAPALQHYLSHQGIAYDVIPHEATLSSTRTAEACHVSGDCLAKGVLLRDRRGYLLAVLPASHRIRLSELQDELGSDVELAAGDGGRVVVPRLRAGRDPACGCLLWARDDHRRELGSAAGGLFRGRGSRDAGSRHTRRVRETHGWSATPAVQCPGGRVRVH